MRAPVVACLAHSRACPVPVPSLIREFEKEARADGQDANAVQRKKTVRACSAGRHLWLRVRVLLASWAGRTGCAESPKLRGPRTDAPPLPAVCRPRACRTW